jgi:mRNA interferase RelE/StbE
MWRVEVSNRAERDLTRLPVDEKRRIVAAILALRDGPEPPNCRRLEGRPEWRLRVGRWRVLFVASFETHRIDVLSVGPRGDVYK